MRFDLVAALALIAGAAASPTPRENVAPRAFGTAAVGPARRSLAHGHAVRARGAAHAQSRRARTRKCRAANGTTSTVVDNKNLWAEPSTTSSEDATSTSAEQPAATAPAGQVQDSSPDPAPTPANTLALFSTDPSTGDNAKIGSFASMTNAAINDNNKYAYDNLKDNGDGSVTFTFDQGSLSTNTRDSWYYYTTADPGNTGMNLTAAKTASFTYSIRFQSGFEFNMGGKLPGWYGGDSQEDAKACTGHNGKSSCFSSRIMWRENGMGEIYNYYWPTTQAYCTNPSSYDIGSGIVRCTTDSGDSVGRGSFSFVPGQWLTITNTITLNSMNGDSPNADGRQVISINGQPTITINDLVIRHHEEGRLRGLFFSSFFGGDQSSWASPKTQSVDFKDITVGVLENL